MSRAYRVFGAVLAGALLVAQGVLGQDSLGFQRYQLINIDFQRKTLTPGFLPFDVPYRISVPAPDSLGIDSVWIQAWRVKGRFRKPESKTAQPLIKNLDQTDSANSILGFVRNPYTKDSLYANINVPLRPSRSYQFDFHLFRRVTDKESKDLDSIFSPVSLKALDSIYSSNDSDSILGALQDPKDKNVRSLIASLTDLVLQYYSTKNVYPGRDSIEKGISHGLPAYFASSYGTPFRSRLQHFEKVINLMQTDLACYGSADGPDKLENNALIKKLAKLCWKKTDLVKYHIDTPLMRFVRGMLMDHDSLALCFQGKRTGSDSAFEQGKTYPSARVALFRSAIVSFYDSCGKAMNLIKNIRNDPELSGFFTGGDQAQLTTELARFALFYNEVQKLKKEMDAYYGQCILYDSLMAKAARFKFRSEFNIVFNDRSIGMTSADFVTRGAWYMIADIGFAYVNTYPTGQVRPYAGVNFNVFPINRQASYSLFKHPYYTAMGNVIRSLSVTVGVTLFSTFGAKDRYTELLGTTGSPLTGIALRLSDGIRLSSGAMWVYQKSANPLSDAKTLVPLWYASLSVDLSLKKWLGGLVKFFN
jgi:hypothetical protein